jgi:hypothetical protein
MRRSTRLAGSAATPVTLNLGVLLARCDYFNLSCRGGCKLCTNRGRRQRAQRAAIVVRVACTLVDNLFHAQP